MYYLDKIKEISIDSKTKYLLGGGAIAMTSIIAPYTIPVALNAIGFTTGGVASGTIAASMMSYFGTSSILVPTLQSIGAAGVSASTTSVVTGGVALGLSIPSIKNVFKKQT